MPRVTFVNEHRVVECDAGRSVHEVARANGIEVGRVCWIEGDASARTFLELLRGMRGARRLPDRVRVLGDVKVTTAPAASRRVGVARDIAPPPSPASDPSAPRKPIDAASTAEHVRGHPSAVGHGAASAIPPAPESKPNAARPLSTIPPPPENE